MRFENGYCEFAACWLWDEGSLWCSWDGEV